jgi:D-proline reductase (dithiol) PrdB
MVATSIIGGEATGMSVGDTGSDDPGLQPVEGFAIIERDIVRRGVPTFDWTRYAEPSPRQRLEMPIAEARVALIATPGAYQREQRPFDAGAKDGDPSHLVISADVAREDICFCHPGIDLAPAQADTDCVFPVQLLCRMAAEGRIGAVAPHAVALMGYMTQIDVLEQETALQIVETLIRDEVDLALLVPA